MVPILKKESWGRITKILRGIEEEPEKKEKTKSVKADRVEVEEKGIPLAELSGLGGATAKKFVELGVTTVEELCKEDPDELASLIKGVSTDRLKKWIKEGKELIK